jgi:hypothetical protein
MAMPFSLLDGAAEEHLLWEQLISVALPAHSGRRLLRYRMGVCSPSVGGLCETPGALVPLHCVARRAGSDPPSADVSKSLAQFWKSVMEVHTTLSLQSPYAGGGCFVASLCIPIASSSRARATRIGVDGLA